MKFVLLMMVATSWGCGSTPDGKPEAAGACSADKGIFGQVVDRTSGEPLWFVKVSTVPPTAEVRTDKAGCFIIADDRSKSPPELGAGKYAVVVDPAPGQVKTAKNPEPVAQVYARQKTGELDYKGEPLAVGVLGVERLSAGESGEVIFTPSNLGKDGRTVDE